MITAKVVVTNSFAAVMAKLELGAQAVCNETAAQAAADIAQGVSEHGGRHGSWDYRSGASAASIYVMFGTKSGFTSNYDEALSAMRELLSGEGIGDYDRRKKYGYQLSVLSTSNLANRLELPRVTPRVSPNSRWAGVASCSRVVWWWETGHHNKFTGMFEYDPTFAMVPAQMAGNFAGRFAGCLNRGAAGVTVQRQGRFGAGTRGNVARISGKPSAVGNLTKLSLDAKRAHFPAVRR